MQHLLCLTEIGERHNVHMDAKQYLVPEMIQRYICVHKFIFVITSNMQICVQLCAGVHTMCADVKRWAVVGGNKRMGRQGSQHATCSNSENLLRKKIFVDEHCFSMRDVGAASQKPHQRSSIAVFVFLIFRCVGHTVWLMDDCLLTIIIIKQLSSAIILQSMF